MRVGVAFAELDVDVLDDQHLAELFENVIVVIAQTHRPGRSSPVRAVKP